MTVTFKYDEKENFVYSKFSGILTDEDLEEIAKALAAEQRVKPCLRELVDLRAVDSVEASPESLGTIIHVNIEHREKYEGKKIAIVAPRELLYGLSKYFEVISDIDNAPFAINVVRTMAEAREWLHISEHHNIP